MRICFILPTHWSHQLGGSEIQVKYLIDHLLNEINCEIYYLCKKTALSGQHGKVNIWTIPSRWIPAKFSSFFTGDLGNTLKSIKPDLIYTRVGKAHVRAAAEYSRSNRCKSIWHVASESDVVPFNFTLKKSVLLDLAEKKALEGGIRKVDYIIGQAAYQENLLKTFYGRKCDLVVPNYHPLPTEEITKDDPIKIVWIANYKCWKRPELFVSLAQRLKKRAYVKFQMIGRKPDKPVFYPDCIEHIGERSTEEVNRILCDAHILVNTSKFEGFPNTFIQAWMRKVPVVSLSVDPDDVLKKAQIGLHSRSFEQLVADVSKLIDDHEYRRQMGERARLYAFRYHSLSNINKIADFFKMIA